MTIFDDKKLVNSDIEVDPEIYRYRSRDYYRENRRINTQIKFGSDTDTDSDSYLYNTDSDSDSDPDEYFNGKDKYLNNIGEDRYENDFEEVFIEAYNDEYDVY